jgi:F0F1-type ATP synthase membrane subunit c/vacuolar-type H+-ATPase subunit K
MMDGVGVNGWLGQYPEFSALMILAVGVLLAFLARKGVSVLTDWLNRASVYKSARVEPIVSPSFTRVLRVTVFWGILVAAVIKCAVLLGGPQAVVLDVIWTFVIRLLVALGIVVVGHFLGVFARNLVTMVARHPDMGALPMLVYALTIGVALVMALAHLGLDVSLITNVSLVIVAVVFASLGLAFALGARTLVANLAAQGELGRYRPGDRLRVDGTEGLVLEVDRTGVVLSTAEGLARIPAARLADSTVLLLTPEDDTDG